MTTSDHGDESVSRGLSARQIARRLIESRGSEQAGARTAAGACDQFYRELSRWVGADGCHALFVRALAQATTEFPLFRKIQLHARSEPYVEGVSEAIKAYGDDETAEALQALLIRLVELLGRLIGDDMVMKLIDRSVTASARGDSSSNREREEA